MILGLGAIAADASPLTIAWDPVSDSTVRGYLVFAGTSPTSLTESYDVGRTTTYTYVATPGVTYYFAVAAYVDASRPGPRTAPISALVPTTAAAVSARSPIPHERLTLRYTDSEERTGENGAAKQAIDGNPATRWVTQWATTTKAMPHEIQIGLGALYSVSGFRYLPRQDGTPNGGIARYEFYVSTDGVNWGQPVATGTFPKSFAEQQVTFTPKVGQYVRLRALSEINGNPWTAAAEITVLEGGTAP